MTTTAGSPVFRAAIERPDDGDPTAGATFQSVDELADRTKFLQTNAALAIANPRFVKSVASIDRLSRVCWAPGAGPFDYGMFVAAGIRSGGGAGVALSPDGEQWYDYTWASITLLPANFRGVAHGGSGVFGSRQLAFCGWVDDGANDRPVIITMPDDAEDHSNPLIPEIIEGDFTYSYLGAALDAQLRSICTMATGGFCAVGDSGLIVTLSADLVTDTVRTPGSSYTGDFHHVFADSAGRLFACGENGEIQRSTDNGATWARVFGPDATLGTLRSGVAVTLDGVESLVIGTSDENKVLRSTAAGAAATWTEIEIVPTATFDGSQVLVHKLGSTVCAVIRNETNDSIGQAFYSFDGGATWPYTNQNWLCYGTHVEGAAENGRSAVVVGGSPDGTTAGQIFATDRVIAPV